eukprot:m.159551 g.159551  ORF g.159551 m.159551 type:complete len:307 (-) comp15155_c0_seq6:1614-2534(-)
MLLVIICLLVFPAFCGAGRKAPELPSCAVAHRLFKQDKPQSLYKIFGVTPKAKDAQIKSQFRKLQRKCHPDMSPTDPKANEKASSINAAYSILSDDKERRKYDHGGYTRKGSEGRGGGGNPFGGNPFGGFQGGGRRGGGGQGFNFNFGGGGGSPFANMFGGGGGGGRRPRQQQGSPFGNMFGGGGRNRRANQGSSSLDRQAVFLKSNVQRYYKLINVKKPDTSVNAMAIKFKNDPDGLFRKLAGKYKKDPRTILEGDVRKKVQAYYQKIGKSINDPENKKKITQMSKKYALDPNTLFRKLKKKYGK